MEKKKLSTTYKLKRRLGFNYSEEEYGDVSFWRVFKFFGNIHRKRLEKMIGWAMLDLFLSRKLRSVLLRKIDCHVGKNAFIGDYVRVDLQHVNMIYIGEYAHIISGCRQLCHQRDLKNHRVGDNAALRGYRKGDIHIWRDVMVGMESSIMLGVIIGEGAIMGAGSLGVKDKPALTVAMGVLAKVVKVLSQHSDIHDINREGVALPFNTLGVSYKAA